MSSIKVAVRCRPLFENERPATGLDIQGRRILLDSKTYDPDYTFTPTCSQDDILVVARPILQCVKDGLNGTIMVYGQTGTGKTYTMLGQDGADNGLVHAVIAEMLEHLQTKTRDGVKCALTLSMIEIYNEKLTDMLSPNGEEEVALINGFPRSTCKATLCRVSDANEAINTGLRWRHTAATMMNDRSSRSHVVFIVDFEQYNEFTEQMDVAHLFLVDLAGSESLKKSQASGATATEAGKINKSLLALKSVFLALSNTSEATRPTHVPYRDSKLTELLQDSIGGTARTLMIACISSVGRDIEETKSTLMYAVKARSIRNAANTEKEKLLIRLRSLETENQKIRNRLQERVSERGGYYVTKEEHEVTERLEVEVAELRESVTQLMHDRQNSEAHQHISESQQKILLVMIEEKEDKLRQAQAVYRETLNRFEHQANTLQRIVQSSVRQSKLALQSSSEETVARLEQWKREMLTVVDNAAAPTDLSSSSSMPVKEVCAHEAVGQGKPHLLDEEDTEAPEESLSQAQAGSPTLSAQAVPTLMPPLPQAPAVNGMFTSAGSRRSSPAPSHARGLSSHPVSQRGSVVTTVATAPSSQAGSPSRAAAPPPSTSAGTTTAIPSTRAARALRRGPSASRSLPQSLFSGGGGAGRQATSLPAPPLAPCGDEEEPNPVPSAAPSPLATSACPGVTVDTHFLDSLDEECRRLAGRLNACFRELAEACVEAAQQHVQSVQTIQTARQARTQHSLQQLRKALDEHIADVEKAEQHAAHDLERTQVLYTDDMRKYTQYPEPITPAALQQLTRGASLATVRSAETVFPSCEAPAAVQASLDALVRNYQRKMTETAVSGLLPLSSTALDAPFTATPYAQSTEGVGPSTDNALAASSPTMAEMNAAEAADPATTEAEVGSPQWQHDSSRSTQSQRDSSMPSTASTGQPDFASSTNVPPSTYSRTGAPRRRPLQGPRAPLSAALRDASATAASVARKPRLPFAASSPRRESSRHNGRDNSVSRLQNLPGNTAAQRARLGEKRSRSSLSTSGASGRFSGRQSTVDTKKPRSTPETDSQN